VLAIGVIALGLYAIHHFSGISSSAPAPGQVRSFGTPQSPVDPVDGQPVTVDSNTPQVNYSGTIYYFDSDRDVRGRSHKMLFLMDPLHYLTGSAPLIEPAPFATTPVAVSGAASALAADVTLTAATSTALPSPH
jgi:YHS domain-containing protein